MVMLVGIVRYRKEIEMKELLEELEKRFVDIIKLCDHIAYDKKDIRQTANDACSFIYLKRKELKNE